MVTAERMLHRTGGRVQLGPRLTAPRSDVVLELARLLDRNPRLAAQARQVLSRSRPREGSRSVSAAVKCPPRRETTSDGWPIVEVDADVAADAGWWARLSARDLGVSTPTVKFYRAPTTACFGFTYLGSDTVFIRSGMSLEQTRSTIAHEVWHLAIRPGERGARRYEANRRRGAWWATPREPVEPTADEWAMHAAELRARRDPGDGRPPVICLTALAPTPA
jgi:hypothetical protein